MNTLLKIKKTANSPVAGCTSIDGKVVAFTKSEAAGPRGVKHLVNTRDQLRSFCRDFVKKPLEDFLVGWQF